MKFDEENGETNDIKKDNEEQTPMEVKAKKPEEIELKEEDENDKNNEIKNKFNMNRFHNNNVINNNNAEEDNLNQVTSKNKQATLTSPNNHPKGCVVKTSENNILGGNLAFSFANPVSKNSNVLYESQLVSHLS